MQWCGAIGRRRILGRCRAASLALSGCSGFGLGLSLGLFVFLGLALFRLFIHNFLRPGLWLPSRMHVIDVHFSGVLVMLVVLVIVPMGRLSVLVGMIVILGGVLMVLILVYRVLVFMALFMAVFTAVVGAFFMMSLVPAVV